MPIRRAAVAGSWYPGTRAALAAAVDAHLAPLTRDLLLLTALAVVSGIVSFVVLSRQRDAMSGALVFRLRQFRSRLDEGTRTEDD